MKEMIKCVAFILATLVVVPFVLGVKIEKITSNGDSFFQGSSQLLSLIPFRFGQFLRAAFYAHSCPNTAREITISFLTLFSHTDTEVGKHVYIGPQSNIGSCSIGNDCLIGSGVHILSGKHQHDTSDMTRPFRLQGGTYEKINIGENCWIGNQATIMANVGANSIVAAGAVVVETVEPNSIVAGNPARLLRTR